MRSEIAKKRSLDPAATRKAIIDAAIEGFAESGYDGFSIQAVADAAGVPKSLVLYHFKSKDELWTAALGAKLRPLMEVFERFVHAEASEDALREMAKYRFQFLLDNPEVPRFMAWYSMQPSAPSPQVRQYAELVVKKVRENADALGVPPGMRPEIFVLILMSAIDGWLRFKGLYSILNLNQEWPQGTDEEFFEALVSLLFAHRSNEKEAQN